jgi:ethanolamine utilization protein EutP
MKRLILVGKRGSGKTTLIQKLLNLDIKYKKTQTIEFQQNMIDTPGEYLENRQYNKALLSASIECDGVLLLKDCTDMDCIYPPGYALMFNKRSVGIVTKIDCEDKDIENSIICLQNAGVEKIFLISCFTDDGVDALKEYLE